MNNANSFEQKQQTVLKDYLARALICLLLRLRRRIRFLAHLALILLNVSQIALQWCTLQNKNTVEDPNTYFV